MVLERIDKFTEEQKQLMEDNYNLVYSWLHMRRLSVQEFEAIVVIGYCRGIVKWTESDRTHKVSSFAYMGMNGEYATYIREQMKKHGNLSNIDDHIECASYDDGYVELVETMMNVLNEKEVAFVSCRYMGYTLREIAIIMGMSYSWVWKMQEEVKKKMEVALR